MKEAIELAQPTYQKHIYVYLNPDNPAWRAGKEIILSYETLFTEILSGAAEIHTFQTWPLTFERDLGLKYG